MGRSVPGLPCTPASRRDIPPALGPPALSSRDPQQSERDVLPLAGRLTWAMPAPISPPPMTVTCLITIFFAEAEAVDEEDTARTNCLVTKAMVHRRRRRQGQRQPDAAKAPQRGPRSQPTSGGGAQAARRPRVLGVAVTSRRRGGDPRLAPPFGREHATTVERRSAASRPTWAGEGRRLPPRT